MAKPEPTEVEVKFEGGNMITETDLRGRITYVNRLFVQMTGYDKEELIGKPHSIIRHPDMPKCCFRSMWETVMRGEMWEGYVKNLRKDGAYYWVNVIVTPKYNENGMHCGYIAVRKPPGELTLEETKIKYARILQEESCRMNEAETTPPTP